ncbi:MAG: TAXI family TRAP transporter solute-binding subunit [Gammaproteobacteria bacterium]|nr:TAXI family TRAP transporter solute-binding subunit [Gammaproteobacteria bacterium]
MYDARRRFLLAAAGAVVAGATPALLHAQLRRVAIGANPAGTNFNVIAGGFAKVIQQKLGIASIVRPYSGSSVYLPMLQRGEITLGINSGIDSYLAYNGEPPYPAPMTNLRALMAVYPLGYMFWVRADGPIRRLEDLEGRRVVLNYRGLVPLDRLNRAVLATAGLTESDVEPVTAAGLPEGARLVAEGRAEAVAMGYRLPLVLQTHATLPRGLRFLSLGADEGKVAEIMPGAWADTVTPSATTVGIEAPARFAMYDTYLNGGVHLADEDAYRITKVLYESWPELQRDYALLREVDRAKVAPSTNPHPYHAGAAAFLEEIGLK